MIEQVKDYIKAHYAEDMSIKELADVACVSQNYFSALFKKETGQNYKAYRHLSVWKKLSNCSGSRISKPMRLEKRLVIIIVVVLIDAFKQIIM